MSNQIVVPSLGESVTEATVSKWLKQVGEKVDSDEPLVELETDKVNIEVPSPLSGTLSSIKVKEGDTVEVGALLGFVQEGKSISSQTGKENESKQSYIPPKKSTIKESLKKEEKITPDNQETFSQINQPEDKSSNGTLILDNLVEDEVVEPQEKKYTPPKKKKHLSSRRI